MSAFRPVAPPLAIASALADEAAPICEAALVLALFLMLPRLAFAYALGSSGFARIGLELVVLLPAVGLLRQRGYPRLAVVATCVALWRIGGAALFIATAGCFSVGRAFPMADAPLAALDAALGFRWVDYLAFVDRHAWLDTWILRPAYLSIFWQPIVAALVLPALGRGRDALTLFVALPAGIMLACAIAVFVPAYGAYHHYGVTAALHPHLADLVTGDGIAASLDWLRAENPVGPLPPDHGGLITFPSFHTTAAILFVWTFRKVPVLFWAAVLLNGALLIAAPLHGSHYLADMAAGAALAPVVIAGVEAAFAATLASRWPATLAEASRYFESRTPLLSRGGGAAVG